jgi:hypothetical protein
MRGLKINKQVGRPDTPLATTPTPDYRNMPNAKKGVFKDRPYVSTSKDTTEYNAGFERALEGKNKFLPSKVSIHGYKEAKERKLLPKQNKK